MGRTPRARGSKLTSSYASSHGLRLAYNAAYARAGIGSGAMGEPFTFHDLRAKRASDAADPEEATERLARDPWTTRAMYLGKSR
jgi:integrase